MMNLYAYNGEEPYIFISYSHRDQDLVYPIIAQMQKDGYRVWFDEGICPGTVWDDTIANCIDKCWYFIAFMSKNYLNSGNCMDELEFARDRTRRRVLVYLEEVVLPGGVAMRTNRIQSIFKYRYKSEPEFFRKLYLSEEMQNCSCAWKDGGMGFTARPSQSKVITASNGYAGKIPRQRERRWGVTATGLPT